MTPITRSLRTLLVAAPIVFGACKKADAPPANPPAPPPSAAIAVTDVKVANAVDQNKAIATTMAALGLRDTMYVSVRTDGAAEDVPIVVRWTAPDGSLILADTQRVTTSGPATHESHISRPRAWPAGKYKVEVQLGNSPARTMEFDVR